MTGIDITAQPIGLEYEDIVKVLKTQITEHSLPLWYSEGWDPAAGGFVEKLDIEGRPDRAAPRRGSRPGATDLLLRQGRRPGLVSSRPRKIFRELGVLSGYFQALTSRIIFTLQWLQDYRWSWRSFQTST
jgi:hypothetical protein